MQLIFQEEIDSNLKMAQRTRGAATGLTPYHDWMNVVRGKENYDQLAGRQAYQKELQTEPYVNSRHCFTQFRAFTNVPHARFAQPMSRNSRACSFHSSA